MFEFDLNANNINFSATNNNLLVSGLSADYNDLSIVRQIPDTRDFRCPKIFPNLEEFKAKVSIIITYHNETQAILYRTINSIFKRTPLKYLEEIIIIDDCSEDDLILQNIQKHFKYIDLIKCLRNSKRLGLIKSRNLGAQMSSGDYLMFMDSHCEVNAQWLETLLAIIVESNNTRMAVSPVLDNIDVVTNEYKATSAFIKGGFDWNLHFHWIARDETLNPIVPFRSPTFAGGVFLISRNWFFKLKAFNTRLEIWGGESLEFSLKLWLCGGDRGEIKIVPCSRVGHIFRKEHIFKFPNNDGQQTYLRNSKIIAETWLEHYKYIFYNLKPEARNIAINDTRVLDKQFKDALNCQPFEWYLQNIFPELRPFENYTASGIITSSAFVSDNLCLHHDLFDDYNSTPLMCNCLTANITHWFLLRITQQLQSQRGFCLNVIQPEDRAEKASQLKVVMEPCWWPAKQSWHRFGQQLRHSITGLCLEITVDYNITVNPCRREAAMQYFIFEKELERP
ncbi:putative polypeptide N-acetylgalactosaminyltransferase 13 [Calliphora vicina]|uniref:putative polypeptide N-acetylgalactosaminyltransferase 13 n=1 Tax=Calliphora vicina TaxID=7373 RepID=UPI00325B215B